MIILVYNFKVNNIIEKGYKLITNVFAKMTEGSKRDWIINLPIILFADRCIIKVTTR